LKDRITAKEVKAWERYRLVFGPYGREREDYNAAMLASALYSLRNCLIVVNGGEGSSEPQLQECCLKFDLKFKDESDESETIATETVNPELAHLDPQLRNEIERFMEKW
jgi:hypothetical protein